MRVLIAATALALASGAIAQNVDPDPPTATYAELIDMKVPVVEGDITDRPYRVIGEIETEVRKTMILSKTPSREKVFRELWERGEKMGADAVINARYGNSRVTFASWGARHATGQAVKFLTDEEIADGGNGTD